MRYDILPEGLSKLFGGRRRFFLPHMSTADIYLWLVDKKWGAGCSSFDIFRKGVVLYLNYSYLMHMDMQAAWRYPNDAKSMNVAVKLLIKSIARLLLDISWVLWIGITWNSNFIVFMLFHIQCHRLHPKERIFCLVKKI